MKFLALVLISSIWCAAQGEGPRQRIGKYEVQLRLPADGLYAGEEMQIEYRVVDTSRVDAVMGAAPVIRAATKSVIDMPAMQGMPALEELAHPEGIPGEYGVHPLFAHGGEYRLRLSIKPLADAQFTATFMLDVGDASQAINRKPKPKPYTMDVKVSPKAPKAGEEVELVFSFHRRESGKSTFRDFVIQHEKLMHLLIVREDLGYFSHEHPQMGEDGLFRVRYTFPTAGEFHLFGDVAPQGAGSQVMMVKVKVSGKGAPKYEIGKVERKPVFIAGGLKVEFPGAMKAIGTRKTQSLVFEVSDQISGAPATNLEPYLGAMGHLILIHEDGVTLVHSHPDERIPEVGKNGRVAFLARFPKPGNYRGWAQFQRDGKVVTSAFVMSAAASGE